MSDRALTAMAMSFSLMRLRRKVTPLPTGFDRLFLVVQGDRIVVDAVGVLPHHRALLAEEGDEERLFTGGDVADREDAGLTQLLAGRLADAEELARRQRPQKLAEVFPRDLGGGVGLLVLAAHLGKGLVEGNAGRKRHSQLFPDCAADGVSDLPSAAEQLLAGRDVEPRLIDAERLDHVGKALIDFVDQTAVIAVFFHVRTHEHQLGTFFLRLPDGLRRYHSVLLGQLIFGQNDAVTAVGIAADGHGLVLEVRTLKQLYRSVEAVHVTVQYDALPSAFSAVAAHVLPSLPACLPELFLL